MNAKILLVDDKNELKNVLDILLAERYETITVENTLTALNILESGYMPDVIITDSVNSHDESKLLLTMINDQNSFKDIPVIIISSIRRSSKKAELLNSGAIEYFVKPFGYAELEKCIEKALLKE